MTYHYSAALFAERNRNRVYQAVVQALEEASAKRGITRAELASKIGRSSPQISRWLSGPSNWTLDTISDLLYAIDAEMDYFVVPHSARATKNMHHSLGEPTLRSDNIQTSSNPTPARFRANVLAPARFSLSEQDPKV